MERGPQHDGLRGDPEDLGPDDLHWTFSDTGWAKTAWGKLFGQRRLGAAVFRAVAETVVVGKPDRSA